jgi:hypothetical protein
MEKYTVGIIPTYLNEEECFIDVAHIEWLANYKIVPLSYRLTDDELNNILPSLHLVYISSGMRGLGINKPNKAFTKRILTIIKSLNDIGKYLPIWAVCLGFELLCEIEAPSLKLVKLDVPNYFATNLVQLDETSLITSVESFTPLKI